MSARDQESVKWIASLDVIAIDAERARRSFHFFFQRFAWPVLQPATPFKDNWHVGAICEHLTAVKQGQIRRLLINMPFRMLKSSLVSHAFPVWDWINNPSRQFLTASYSKDIATRDAVDSRRVIESQEYQRAFGHLFEMTGDQNVKSRYENDKRGMRTVTSTDGAGTGFGGDIRIVDDPVSAKDANSPLALAASIEWWKGTMATRANDPSHGAVIVVHQRLNQNDLTGYLLEEEEGWDHLVLPFRYESKFIRKPTSIGFVDPRKVEGELIHPDRIPEQAAQELEKTLGSYHATAQLQQCPTARGGLLIRGEWFKRYTQHPTLKFRKIFADTAMKTKESNDYSVFQCWGLGDDGKIYLLDQIRGKWEAPELRRRAIDFWNAHLPRALHTGAVRKMCIEDKASGTGLIQDIRTSAKIPVEAIERSTDKYTRVCDGLSYIEAGLVCLPEDAPWVNGFIDECEAFTPNNTHEHDDQIDPMMDAIKDMLAVEDKMLKWAKLGR